MFSTDVQEKMISKRNGPFLETNSKFFGCSHQPFVLQADCQDACFKESLRIFLG